MNPHPHRPEDMASPATPGTGSGTPGVFHDWALMRYAGNPVGALIPVSGEGLCLGRIPEHGLCLPGPEVSRAHAQLRLVQEGEAMAMHLEDLGSTNGTYLNGRRIEGRVPVDHGDVMHVGKHAFKIKRLDEMERRYHEAAFLETTADPLTGVSNRVTVLNHLEKHFALSKRHQRPLSLILADLDHFKRINGTWGHAAGDAILQAFGIQLLGRLRNSDPVGRIGGDEFLIVLPETSGRQALRVAEDVRAGIAEDPVNLPGTGAVKVTCSLGVAEFHDLDPSAGALLARVDAVLSRAKTEGRNRFILAEN